MSFNLLAEFDSFYQKAPVSNNSPGNSSLGAAQTNKQENPWAENTPDDGPYARSGQLAQSENSDDGDDWGEFETGTKPQISLEGGNDFGELNVWGEEPRKPTNMFESWSNSGNEHESPPARMVESEDVEPFDQVSSNIEQSLPSYDIPTRPRRDSNVLFDVEDEILEDDDFGDFETAEELSVSPDDGSVNVSKRKDNLSNTLIDIDFEQTGPFANTSTRETNKEVHRAAGVDFFEPLEANVKLDRDTDEEWGFEATVTGEHNPKAEVEQDLARYAPPTSSKRNAVLGSDPHQSQPDSKEGQHKIHTVVEVAQQGDHDFDAWEEFEGADVHQQAQQAKADISDAVASRDNATTTTSQPAQQNEDTTGPEPDFPQIIQSPNIGSSLPPANVPPPGLLLQLFPPIFSKVHSNLSSILPEPKDDDNTRRRVLSLQSTKNFLVSYLSIATVLAHIIAGSKLRWKRDTLLSQSMRIGPASSAKSSGMKLAGVDKGESAKEDREIADVVKAWRVQLGRLRGIIAGASLTTPIPEVSETLTVRLATKAEAPVSAPKACALCGLKRNERVPKVDVDVHDDFGEYWQEHWGHKLCMDFWYSYRDRLQSR